VNTETTNKLITVWHTAKDYVWCAVSGSTFNVSVRIQQIANQIIYLAQKPNNLDTRIQTQSLFWNTRTTLTSDTAVRNFANMHPAYFLFLIRSQARVLICGIVLSRIDGQTSCNCLHSPFDGGRVWPLNAWRTTSNSSLVHGLRFVDWRMRFASRKQEHQQHTDYSLP
jgi:hypothetical protein